MLNPKDCVEVLLHAFKEDSDGNVSHVDVSEITSIGINAISGWEVFAKFDVPNFDSDFQVIDLGKFPLSGRSGAIKLARTWSKFFFGDEDQWTEY